ncbi:hypothetical protein [Nostoc sp.]|uniref:hypothetical protein n=1 Tax=Nostoc sp. TaxID=1180 RepID=UPI002FFC9E23
MSLKLDNLFIGSPLAIVEEFGETRLIASLKEFGVISCPIPNPQSPIHQVLDRRLTSSPANI